MDIAHFSISTSSIPSSLEIPNEIKEAVRLNLKANKLDLSKEMELVNAADIANAVRIQNIKAKEDANLLINPPVIQPQETIVQFNTNSVAISNDKEEENKDRNNTEKDSAASAATTEVAEVTNITATTNGVAEEPPPITSITSEGQSTNIDDKSVIETTSDVKPPNNSDSNNNNNAIEITETPKLPIPGEEQTNVEPTAIENAASEPNAAIDSLVAGPGSPIPEGILINSNVNTNNLVDNTAAVTVTPPKPVPQDPKKVKIASFKERTGETDEVCIFYLEMMDYDLIKSLEMYDTATKE